MIYSYADLLERKRKEYGTKFDPSALNPAFIPFFESQQRIKIFCGAECTGTVGVTTGWKPCFLLMRRSNAIGSSFMIRMDTTIIAVKVGRHYVPFNHQGATL